LLIWTLLALSVLYLAKYTWPTILRPPEKNVKRVLPIPLPPGKSKKGEIAQLKNENEGLIGTGRRTGCLEMVKAKETSGKMIANAKEKRRIE